MKPLNKKNDLLKHYDLSKIDCKNVYPWKKIYTSGLLLTGLLFYHVTQGGRKKSF